MSKQARKGTRGARGHICTGEPYAKTLRIASLRARDDIKTVQFNLGSIISYSGVYTRCVWPYGHATDPMKQERANRMDKFMERLAK